MYIKKVGFLMWVFFILFLVRPLFQVLCEDEIMRNYLIQNDYYRNETAYIMTGKGQDGFYLPGILKLDYILEILQCIAGMLFFLIGLLKIIYSIKKNKNAFQILIDRDSVKFDEIKYIKRKQILCIGMYVCGGVFMIRPIYHCIRIKDFVGKGIDRCAYLGHVGAFKRNDVNHTTLLRSRLLYSDICLEILQYIVVTIWVILVVIYFTIKKKSSNNI